MGVTAFNDHYSFIFFRGLALPNDFNTRILVLVDGHRINDANYQTGFVGEEFPGDIENIERIEITKGPGSAVWGTNAMLGLINVVTRKGSEGALVETSVAYGTGDRTKTFVSAGTKLENGLDYRLSASYFNSDGDRTLEFETPDHLDKMVARDVNGQEYNRLTGRFDWNDLKLVVSGGARSVQVPYGFYGAQFGDGGNVYEDYYTYADLSYDHEIDHEDSKRIFARYFYDNNRFLGDFVYEGEEPGGRLRGTYRVSRARPGFAPRLAYFGLDRAWYAAMDEAPE